MSSSKLGYKDAMEVVINVKNKLDIRYSYVMCKKRLETTNDAIVATLATESLTNFYEVKYHSN